MSDPLSSPGESFIEGAHLSLAMGGEPSPGLTWALWAYAFLGNMVHGAFGIMGQNYGRAKIMAVGKTGIVDTYLHHR